MIRSVCITSVMAALFLLLGCINHGENPISGNPSTDLELDVRTSGSGTHTHLWGYYDVYIDIPTKKIHAVPNRNAMFAANVVEFLNGKTANMAFKIIDTPVDPDGKFIDVDIDVSIKHPFPGLTQYNGYDVRGVFLGNGSKTLKYSSDLKYFARGAADQEMYDYNLTSGDIHTGLVGMPDGFTRWFNAVEFGTPGLFGYTKGIYATKNYGPTATLNPYKYFADGLDPDEDLWEFLMTSTKNGVFSAGATNTRNYYLRFPTPDPGVQFAYAVVANWKGKTDHPANAVEAVGIDVDVTPHVYYVDPTNNGGKLILDLHFAKNWYQQPSTIYIESTVLKDPYQLSAWEMVPVGGGANYSTYHTEIPADNVTSTGDQEFWVIAQYDAYDYTNSFGVSNDAGTDKLAAFFRYDLFVASAPQNLKPVINGISDDIPPAGLNTTVYSSNTSVTYTVDFTDPDVGQTHTISWYIESASATGPTDPPDTMPYNWQPNAVGNYKIWVKVHDGIDTAQGGPYNITKANTLPTITSVTDNIPPAGINPYYTTSHTSVTYTATYTDPDPGQTWTQLLYIEPVTANAPTDPPDSNPYNWALTPVGDYRIWMKVYDGFGSATWGPSTIVSRLSNPPGGWVRTWGGDTTNIEQSHGMCIMSDGCILVAGVYSGTNVDFDPGPQTALKTWAGGTSDMFLVKYNPGGAFQWVKTWGTTGDEVAYGVVVDSSDNIYMSGHFNTNMDFDPGPGTVQLNTNGLFDSFMMKLDSAGNFLWAKSWGGGEFDIAYHPIIDRTNGFVYTYGFYRSAPCDFDPGSGVVNRSNTGGQSSQWCDAYLQKFDLNGNWLAVATWGSAGYEIINKGFVDSSGNLYLTGLWSNTVDFDPGAGVVNRTWASGQAATSHDSFLLSLNSAGTFRWVGTIGNIYPDSGLDAEVYGSHVYWTGWWRGTMDFDPGSPVFNKTAASTTHQDMYIARYSVTTGAFDNTWASTVGGPVITILTGGSFTEQAYDIAIDSSGNIYTCGIYGSLSGDWDPDPLISYAVVKSDTSDAVYDMFIHKLNNAGVFQWVRQFGRPATDDAASFLSIWSATQDLYVCGYFSAGSPPGPLNFHPSAIDNRTSNGAFDAFLIRYLPSGLW